MSTIHLLSLEAARYRMSRRLRAADEKRQRRLARRSFRCTSRAGAGTMSR